MEYGGPIKVAEIWLCLVSWDQKVKMTGQYHHTIACEHNTSKKIWYTSDLARADAYISNARSWWELVGTLALKVIEEINYMYR